MPAVAVLADGGENAAPPRSALKKPPVLRGVLGDATNSPARQRQPEKKKQVSWGAAAAPGAQVDGQALWGLQKQREETARDLRMLGPRLPDNGAMIQAKLATLDAKIAALQPASRQPTSQPPGPPASRPSSQPLPADWVAQTSKTTGAQYYFNTRTGASQFHPPGTDPPRATPRGDSALPAGWTRHMSKSKGKPYFKNLATGATQWHPPALPPAAATAAAATATTAAPPPTGFALPPMPKLALATAPAEPAAVQVIEAPAVEPEGRRRGKNPRPGAARATLRLPASTAKLDLGEQITGIIFGAGSPPAGAPEPAALLSTLMPHQSQALGWMRWRERPAQGVRGGLLADDMGLGKTVSVLALIAAGWQDQATDGTLGRPTLVVCPASLLQHWAGEVARHLRPCRLVVYHGAKRSLAALRYPALPAEPPTGAVVLTTYQTLAADHQAMLRAGDGAEAARAAVFSEEWQRVVLDEGHIIKNESTNACKACCAVPATARWIVSGTPMQNSLAELYPLVGLFLRCGDLRSREVWRATIDNGGQLGREKLQALLAALLLRRTKDERRPDGSRLVTLPQRRVFEHEYALEGRHRAQYAELFAKFREVAQRRPNPREAVRAEPKAKANKLTRLLGLRRFCCHPVLASDQPPADLAASLSRMSISGASVDETDEADAGAGAVWDCSPSPKMKEFFKILDQVNRSMSKEGSPNKSVVVSNFVGFLDLVAVQLQLQGVPFCRIDGGVAIGSRQAVVDAFNTRPDDRVMLLSMGAGAVGLNLVGANHCFVLDLPYNPSVLDQACDRIYRVGQHREISIHTFVCKQSIERWQLRILDRKRQLAKDILAAKEDEPTAADIELLFDMHE